MVTQRLAEGSDLASLGLPLEAFPTDMTADLMNAALDAASDLAMSYFRKRYTPPFVSWGVDVRRCVACIASYILMTRRGYNPAAGSDAVIARMYVDQIGEAGKLGWLDRVSRGDVEPGIVDASPDDEASPLMDADASVFAFRRGGPGGCNGPCSPIEDCG